jgi:hypothetical protein
VAFLAPVVSLKLSRRDELDPAVSFRRRRWLYPALGESGDRLMPTVGAVTEAPPLISPKALSDALAALGAYAEPPTAAQLAAAEFAQGRTGLVTQLSNALYGSALAHVMTAELAVAQGRF